MSGVIDNLGIENVRNHQKKDALIAKAKAEHWAQGSRSWARQISNDKQVAADLEIAQKAKWFTIWKHETYQWKLVC